MEKKKCITEFEIEEPRFEELNLHALDFYYLHIKTKRKKNNKIYTRHEEQKKKKKKKLENFTLF